MLHATEIVRIVHQNRLAPALNDKESFKAGALFERDRVKKAKKTWKQVKTRQTY